MSEIGTGDADGFKVLSLIPQDLLLIHDLVGGELPQASSSSRNQAAKTNNLSVASTAESGEGDMDSIASSSSEGSLEEEGDVDMLKADVPLKEEVDSGANSEEEVEAGLLDGDEGDSSPENSDSDTSDSDSDSDDSSVIEEFSPAKTRELLDSIDDEDGEGGGPGGRPITVHEVLNEDVAIPDIAEVDPKETLERVGEILSVLQDRIVIVKGLTSQMVGYAPDRVLDIETLLVFEDRKVLGYIHETFGPTHQPLYQVRFNDKFPLDKERAQISRPIFHVPGRSNFVFVEKLKLAKGSDASNAHDEEPGEDEVEFSDDEQEAAYKRMLKERRSGSRATTPSTPARRNYEYFEDTFKGSNNPYDEHGAYDTNYGAGPSRPPPIPYDDPYSDSFTSIPTGGDGGGSTTFNDIRSDTGCHDSIRPDLMNPDFGLQDPTPQHARERKGWWPNSAI
ncbi:NAF1-domain-containing protein [Thelephora ganbajun]|uniref:NAF1-domain-containing protein n=1 Tax=Thelephora ganbajun TaxID=370292 RepID=A0ACB6ZKS9_THEGA|nr:NAF1-domain-containing protein [Thelephora ganbajun]